MIKKPLIKITDMSIIYDEGKEKEVHAVKAIDVEIYPKEFLIIFGPSGCGKSTILNAVAGIEEPTKGKVTIAGRDIYKLDNRQISAFHRSELGMIFQAYNLISTLSVLENVALPQIFDSRPFRERYKRAYALLERFGIQEQAKKIPTELSGGQQQRVGIARALINNPLIILADEPIGNLDSKSAELVLQILDDLNKKENKTIIMVTHNPEYLYYANRILYMKDGLIVKTVRNPKKKSIAPGTAQPTESTIDKHIKASSSDIQAKLLTMKFLEKYTVDEKMRFEDTIAKFLGKTIDSESLSKFLDKPYERGGMGFYKQTAKKIGRELNYFKQEISKIKQKINPQKQASDFTNYLLESYRGKISPAKKKLLKSKLYKFLTKKIDLKKLKKFLILSKSKKGLGLRKKTAGKWINKIRILVSKKKG